MPQKTHNQTTRYSQLFFRPYSCGVEPTYHNIKINSSFRVTLRVEENLRMTNSVLGCSGEILPCKHLKILLVHYDCDATVVVRQADFEGMMAFETGDVDMSV